MLALNMMLQARPLCTLLYVFRLYNCETFLPWNFSCSYHIAGKFGGGKVWQINSFRAFGERKWHDWLMSLAMGLAALCDMWRWKWRQWVPFGCFQCRSSFSLPLCGCLPIPIFPASRSASGIGYASKNHLKINGEQFSLLFSV